VDAVRDWVEAFGLTPVIVPDLADSLDGHLIPEGYSTLTYGGTPLARIRALGGSAATLVIGRSLDRCADLLAERTGVPDYRFPDLVGLESCDAFTQALAEISGRPVPARIERARARLLDAMVDTHFPLAGARLAVALDPDRLGSLVAFGTAMGMEVVAAVASARARGLDSIAAPEVVVGDLDDLETRAAGTADLLIANSHAVPIARRLGVPILRCGFPLTDELGGHARTWVGYGGARQTLYDMANLLAAHLREIAPHRSIFWQGGPRDHEARSPAC
jgi:nitrogenase molybdenum-iron protein NifN